MCHWGINNTIYIEVIFQWNLHPAAEVLNGKGGGDAEEQEQVDPPHPANPPPNHPRHPIYPFGSGVSKKWHMALDLSLSHSLSPLTHFTQPCCSLRPLYNLLEQAACTELRFLGAAIRGIPKNHSPLPPPPSSLLAAIGGPLLVSPPGRARLLPLPSRLLSPTPSSSSTISSCCHQRFLPDSQDCRLLSFILTISQLLLTNIQHSATPQEACMWVPLEHACQN